MRLKVSVANFDPFPVPKSSKFWIAGFLIIPWCSICLWSFVCFVFLFSSLLDDIFPDFKRVLLRFQVGLVFVFVFLHFLESLCPFFRSFFCVCVKWLAYVRGKPSWSPFSSVFWSITAGFWSPSSCSVCCVSFFVWIVFFSLFRIHLLFSFILYRWIECILVDRDILTWKVKSWIISFP